MEYPLSEFYDRDEMEGPLETYYDRYSPASSYEKHLFTNRVCQAPELNEIQSRAAHKVSNLGGSIFANGYVVAGGFTVKMDEVSLSAHRVFVLGEVRSLPAKKLAKIVAGKTIGVSYRWIVVTAKDDPRLSDPVAGSKNEGEQGADRLKLALDWSVDGEQNFVPLYQVSADAAGMNVITPATSYLRNDLLALKSALQFNGVDILIDSRLFEGLTDPEAKRMNGFGMFKGLDAIQLVKAGQTICVAHVEDSSLSEAIEVTHENVSLKFSSSCVLTANGSVDHAFKISSDGVQIIGVRTRGFTIPFRVDISTPKIGGGVCIIDRCIGIDSDRLVKLGDGKKHRVLELNSAAINLGDSL